MPVKPRKLKDGRAVFDAVAQNKKRGIPRTKRTFPTRQKANEWLRAVEDDAHNIIVGNTRRRLFGEALAKYLREESPAKLTHTDDVSNARALRWPIYDHETRRFILLEQTPLDDVPSVIGKWVADMREVQRRRYVAPRRGEPAQLYQLRPGRDGRPTWFHQPDPTDGKAPGPRYEVTDARLLELLQEEEVPGEKKGRGPFSENTLRVRKALVKSVLTAVWEKWNTKRDRWLDEDLSRKVSLGEKPRGRKDWATYEQLLSLVIHADIGLDEAILGAAWIGWRKGNMVSNKKYEREIEGLTWSRVVFPIYQTDPLSGRRTEIQPGMIVSSETKNGEIVAQPMSERLEQLLQMRWLQRNGPLVFHRGDGRPLGDFRRRWKRAKREAAKHCGISIKFRWHDLRHTWASHMKQAGVQDTDLQQLGGWKELSMVRTYGHQLVEHLRAAVEAPARKQS